MKKKKKETERAPIIRFSFSFYVLARLAAVMNNSRRVVGPSRLSLADSALLVNRGVLCRLQ